jgi:hypothetical protein
LAKHNAVFDQLDLVTYEEVVKVPGNFENFQLPIFAGSITYWPKLDMV